MSSYALVALVPMRHKSERVPGKNYRELAGRPLYTYILDTLHEVNEIELIVVDTDSQVLREGIRSQYPQIKLIDRPKHLTAGTTSMNEILLHDVRQVESEIYLQTHSTNPLLLPQTIRAAIREFRDDYPENDSLFGVTRLQRRLWDRKGHPLNHDPSRLIRTQDLEPVYEENSCLYIFEHETFLRRENRMGKTSKMFEISSEESLEIDTELDFRIVETALQQR